MKHWLKVLHSPPVWSGVLQRSTRYHETSFVEKTNSAPANPGRSPGVLAAFSYQEKHSVVITWLLDWAPSCLGTAGFRQCLFPPFLSFLFSALLPFRGMRRQYVVGTAQHHELWYTVRVQCRYSQERLMLDYRFWYGTVRLCLSYMLVRREGRFAEWMQREGMERQGERGELQVRYETVCGAVGFVVWLVLCDVWICGKSWAWQQHPISHITGQTNIWNTNFPGFRLAGRERW